MNFVTRISKENFVELVWYTTKYERTLITILRALNINILQPDETRTMANLIGYAGDAAKLLIACNQTCPHLALPELPIMIDASSRSSNERDDYQAIRRRLL